MMTAQDVVTIHEKLEAASIEVWLDGGWGVDALLGGQTRPHDDVDLVVGLDDVPRVRALLAGYELDEDDREDLGALHDWFGVTSPEISRSGLISY